MPPYNWAKGKELSSINPNKLKNEDVLARILIGVEGTDNMVREMKGEFSQLNQMVTSYSASIKQLETQLGQILAQLNVRPKGGLPSETIINLKNDAHIMVIVTRSGRTFGKDVVDPGEDPNENSNEEQANAKKIQLEEIIDNDPKPNETSLERSKVVKENVKSEKAPKVVDDDTPQLNETLIVPLPQIKIPLPFPQRLKKKDDDIKLKKFLVKFSNLSMTIPLLESLQEMYGYAKFMKDLVTKKRVINFEIIEVTHNGSAIMSRTMVAKKEDPGVFTIYCIIGVYKFGKALCDLGASINLISFAVFRKLGLGGLGAPKPTTMRLQMADRLIKKPVGVLYDVLVKVDWFIFLADFVILDCEIDHEVPIILGRPFLATKRALVDVEYGEIKFRVNNEELSFNVCKSMNQSMDLQVVSELM
ncbi:uncharacterized protein LOC107865783 [Capsicum annuum]|uniref:uncharacterized protein LOC107865783 n=1 Tax=Capsicum annuum TaxID=4072 RepID=UPI0007BFE3A0|nr:uncharacterized protein LOC107865783 [Capsicum annuum]